MALGRNEDAKPFLERCSRLVNFIDLVRRNKVRAMETGKGDLDLAMQAVKACDDLGNLWEVYGWMLMTLDLDKQNKALQQEATQLEPHLKTLEHRRTLSAYYPTSKVDLGKLPLPRWKSTTTTAPPHPTRAPASVSFEDRAAAAGVVFQYFDGSDPHIHGLNKMVQINGGGIGILDYDGDGWPDLYFTQGSKDPQDREQTEHLDRLFRNLGNGRFADVTAQAGLVENAFSQGVAIGDVDNDGFPDIYVGNIGSNRLFLNNGDGTFTDATQEAGAADSTWTSSCAIADLNGDSLPDIYTVGFVQGDAFTRICNSSQKRLDPCLPLEFPQAKSHLWLNRGNGRFEDASAAAGIDLPNGKGTALIAADVDGSGKLDLLLGNDGNANFFLKNAAKRGAAPRFFDHAYVAGLALGKDGAPRVPRAGRRGFQRRRTARLSRHEPHRGGGHALPPRLRRIVRRSHHDAGLFEPTFLAASFGTQALDGDLDGNLDLFIANGNVDDINSKYLPYEAPPSYFKHGEMMARVRRGVGEQRGGRPHIADGHVLAAVTVPIESGDGTSEILAFEIRSQCLGRESREAGRPVVLEIARRRLVGQVFAVDVVDVSIGDKQVQIAVEVAIQRLRPETGREKRRLEEAGVMGAIGEQSAGALEVKRVRLLGEARTVKVEPSVAVEIPGGQPEARAGRPPLPSANPATYAWSKDRGARPAFRGVFREEIRVAVIAEKEIQLARAVDVRRNQGRPLAVGQIDAGGGRRVLKAAIAAIEPEVTLSLRKLERRTGVEPFLRTVTNPREGVPLHKPHSINVGKRIAVEIRDRAARRPGRVRGPRLLRGVGKRPVAVIEKQPVRADVSHIDIGEAIVVDIADRDPLAESVLNEAGLRGDVGETAVAQVAEQPVEVLRLLAVLGVLGALGEIKVGPTVAIVVEKSQYRPRDLDHLVKSVNVRIASVEILEYNAGRGGPVLG